MVKSDASAQSQETNATAFVHQAKSHFHQLIRSITIGKHKKQMESFGYLKPRHSGYKHKGHDTFSRKLVHSPLFKVVIFSLLLGNTCWSTFATDALVRDEFSRHQIVVKWGVTGVPKATYYGDNEEEPGVDEEEETIMLATHGHTAWTIKHNIVHTVVLVLFVLEITLRMMSDRWRFVTGRHRVWNIVDVVIVGISLVDLIWSTVKHGRVEYSWPNFTYIRVLKLLQLLFDHFESRSFTFIRLLFKSVMHSLTIVLCSLFIILLMVYSFSMTLEQGVLQFLKGEAAGLVPSDNLIELGEVYGSLTINLVSLFMAVTGGYDWADVMAPLGPLPWWYTVVFLCFVSFLIFGVLNVVTAIFVENAYKLAQTDKKEMVREQIRQQSAWVQQIRDIFGEADQDQSGTLSWDEFQSHIEHPVIKAYFASLDLDFTEARGLFALLDTTGCGQINIQAFVKGCHQLRGEAKSIDLATVRYESLRAEEKIMKQLASLHEKIATLGADEADVLDFYTPGAEMESTPTADPVFPREKRLPSKS